jgi:hypothetical protein
MKAIALALLLISVADAAYAQDCSAVPPKCMNANNRGMQLLQQFPSTTGIYDSASQGYCGALVGIEVNRFCAKQYRAIGRNDCANLLDQQTAEYQNALPQYEAAIDASSANRARQACIWE